MRNRVRKKERVRGNMKKKGVRPVPNEWNRPREKEQDSKTKIKL